MAWLAISQLVLLLQFSLLELGTFSCPVLLQLRDDLVWRVFLSQGPQIFGFQWGAIPFDDEPEGDFKADASHTEAVIKTHNNVNK